MRVGVLIIYQLYAFILLLCIKQQQTAQSQVKSEDNPQPEIDEATLLKDWDIARFFPNKFQSPLNASMDSSSSSLGVKNDVKIRDKEKNITAHRRVESEVKISNPFFRGFRRENSDFFPLSSARHSAIFADRNVNPLRSSGFFNNRRGSDANITGLSNRSNGEPVLTEFVKRNSETPATTNDSVNALKSIGFLRDPKLDFLRPRREKTESDIVLRNSASRQGLRDNLQARRREVESKFSQEADDFRRRSSRPLDIDSLSSLSSAKQSLDAGEYLYLQVTSLISF